MREQNENSVFTITVAVAVAVAATHRSIDEPFSDIEIEDWSRCL